MERRSAAYWLLLLLGAIFLVNGLIMLAAPEPWFVRIAADTGAFNPHLVRDVGAAYATSGIAAIWAARVPHWRAPLDLTGCRARRSNRSSACRPARRSCRHG